MPAVQLARLKVEIAGLGQLFDQPVEFERGVRSLFEFYSDRLYRPGQAVPPVSLIPVYHVSQLVLSQLLLELRPRCLVDQPGALALADQLWVNSHREVRQVSACLLGYAPLEPAEEVVRRLTAWAPAADDPPLLHSLLTEGTARLRREQPGLWLEAVGNLLGSTRIAAQKTGLSALEVMVNDHSFENLPSIFRLITPLVASAPAGLQAPLQDVLEALTRRSPQESLYFLKQALATGSANTSRLARRLLHAFSPESQNSLRTALQAHKN